MDAQTKARWVAFQTQAAQSTGGDEMTQFKDLTDDLKSRIEAAVEKEIPDHVIDSLKAHPGTRAIHDFYSGWWFEPIRKEGELRNVFELYKPGMESQYTHENVTDAYLIGYVDEKGVHPGILSLDRDIVMFVDFLTMSHIFELTNHEVNKKYANGQVLKYNRQANIRVIFNGWESPEVIETLMTDSKFTTFRAEIETEGVLNESHVVTNIHEEEKLGDLETEKEA